MLVPFGVSVIFILYCFFWVGGRDEYRLTMVQVLSGKARLCCVFIVINSTVLWVDYARITSIRKIRNFMDKTRKVAHTCS